VEYTPIKPCMIGIFLRQSTSPEADANLMESACTSVESVHLPMVAAFRYIVTIPCSVVPLQTITRLNEVMHELS